MDDDDLRRSRESARGERVQQLRFAETGFADIESMEPSALSEQDTSASRAGAASVLAAMRQHSDDCSTGIAVTTGENGIVSYANASFRRLAGAEDRLVIGRPFFDAFPRLGSEGVQAVMATAFKRGCASTAEVQVDNGPDDPAQDSLSPVFLTISSVRDAGHGAPNVQGLLVYAHEAEPVQHSQETERVRQASQGGSGHLVTLDAELLEVNQRLVMAALREQELTDRAEEANNAKSAFLTTMSHELRTPLNAIIGYASLIDDEVWGPVQPEQHKHLERLKISARHLLSLINDVLTLARVDADREVVYHSRVDTSALLDEVESLTMPLAVAKHLRYTMNSCEPVTMITDHGKLLQILVNLVSNAIKFTHEGEVSVGASVKGGDIEFVVRDSGIGVSESDLPHLFEMFWQADQDLTRRAGGTGLGLHVSNRLASLLGGHLGVVSTLGEGTTFTLRLPLALPDGAGNKAA